MDAPRPSIRPGRRRDAGPSIERVTAPPPPDDASDGSAPQPDPAAPVRAGRPGGRTSALGRMRATIILIVLNSLMVVAAAVSTTTVAWTSPVASLTGAITPLHLWGALIAEPTRFTDVGTTLGGVAGGEWYRLLTSTFLHFGLLHLALNMFALFALGRDLEGVYGARRFVALYLVSGLGGSVAAYCFSGDAVTAGASGAIFGLFAGIALLLRKLRMSLASVIPVLVINLALTFTIPGISIAGHLGGLATGAVIGAALAFAPRSPRIRRLTVIGVLLVLAIACVVRTLQLTG